jgi:hypothetical protein
MSAYPKATRAALRLINFEAEMIIRIACAQIAPLRAFWRVWRALGMWKLSCDLRDAHGAPPVPSWCLQAGFVTVCVAGVAVGVLDLLVWRP